METIRNEHGNTMLLILGACSVMALMFIAIGSFANVFVYKEKASNNAEQASFVASAAIHEHLQDAIDEYDRSLIGKVDDFLSDSINEKINKEMDRLSSSNPELSNLERKHKAVNTVLKRELRRNPHLEGYINTGLQNAANEIPFLIQQNIAENGGETSDTEILLFNPDDRVEVTTAAKFRAIDYDELFPDEKRNIKQTGQGPEFEFIESLDGWGNKVLTLP